MGTFRRCFDQVGNDTHLTKAGYYFFLHHFEPPPLKSNTFRGDLFETCNRALFSCEFHFSLIKDLYFQNKK